MPGSWSHLTARFFDVVSARDLDAAERARVSGWLQPGEAALFLAQSAADQRHGLTAADRVASVVAGRSELIRAALLHDVGKRHARLGPIGRVAASLAIRLRLPLRGRLRAYRDHGPLGAAELADLGAEPMVVDFTSAHHGSRPDSFDPADWALLTEADAARLPRSPGRGRYPDATMERRPR